MDNNHSNIDDMHLDDMHLDDMDLNDYHYAPGIDNSLNLVISSDCNINLNDNSEKFLDKDSKKNSIQNIENKKRKLEHLSLEDKDIEKYIEKNKNSGISVNIKDKNSIIKSKDVKDKSNIQLNIESVFKNLNPVENIKKWCLISNMAYCEPEFVSGCTNLNYKIERNIKNKSVDDKYYQNKDLEDGSINNELWGKEEEEDFKLKLKIKDIIYEYFEEEPIFFDSSSSGYNDAQAYFCFDKINKTLIVTCRGTESTQDIWSDLQFWQDTLYDVYYHNNYNNYRNLYKKPCLHTGFYNQYNTLKYIIYKHIHEYLYQVKEGNRIRKLNNKIIPRVIFTGHSLGGALATIAATCMSVQFMEHTNLVIECHTFGSPRVGNKSFVDIFNRFVHVSNRYVNDLDPVPMIPRFPGFYHVKGLRHICDAKIDDNILSNKNKKNENKDNKKYQLFDYNKSYQIFQSWWMSVVRIFYSNVEDHYLKNYYFKLSNLKNSF